MKVISKQMITPRRFLLLTIFLLLAINSVSLLVSSGPSQVNAQAREASSSSAAAQAGSLAVITPATAEELAQALDVTGLVSATLNGSDQNGVGVNTGSLGGFASPVDGSFIVLSTGLASNADVPEDPHDIGVFPSSALGGLSNPQGNDLVQLEMIFTPPEEATCLKMNVIFYSEEYPHYDDPDSVFNDTFIAEVMPSNVNSTLVVTGDYTTGYKINSPYNFGYDPTGNPVSVTSPFGFIESETDVPYNGTSGLLQTQGQIPALGPDGNIKIVLSITDMGDSVWDSAIFIDNFLWGYGEDCEEGTIEIPELSVEVIDVEERVCTYGGAVEQDGFLVTIEDWDESEYTIEWRWMVPETSTYTSWEELLPNSTWAEYEEIPYGDDDDFQYMFYHTEGSSVLNQLGEVPGDFQIRAVDLDNEVVASANREFTFTDDSDHAACNLPVGVDVGIEKGGSASSVYVGGEVTFYLTVENFGNETAEDVVIEDTLPLGLNYVSGHASCVLSGDGKEVTCSLGSIEAGDSRVVSFAAQAVEVGNLTNTATVSTETSEYDTTNNSSSYTVNSSQEPAPPPPPPVNHFPNVVLYGTAPAFNDGKINVKSGESFNVVAFINQAGDPNYEYTFGGICSGYISNTSSVTFLSDPLNLAEGLYSCWVTVIDSNGDVSTESVSIIVTPGASQISEPVVEEEEQEEKEEEEDGAVLAATSCEETFKLSGFVYERKNENEERDEDEEGLVEVNVKIYSYDEDGERILVIETKTDADGYYEADLCPGYYEVELSLDTVEANLELVGENLREITIGEEDLENVNFEFEKKSVIAWYLCCIPLLIILILILLMYLLSKRREKDEEKKGKKIRFL